MKIYVVTSGEYSDYHIEIVTTKREVAENYIKNHSTFGYGMSDYEIEEYDDYDGFLDFDELQNKEMVYRFLFNWNIDNNPLEIACCYESKELMSRVTKMKYNSAFFDKNYYYIYVHCDDKEKATKIARDMWAKYQAEKLGL